MDAALNGIESNGVVARVWGEDGDGIARLELVDRGLVGIRVLLVVGGVTGAKGFATLEALQEKVAALFGGA